MQASLIDVDNVLVVAQRRCQDLGVMVKFNPYVETPQTDGKTIVLPLVGTPITTTELENLYGYIIHECGHHLRPDAFKILKAANPPEHLAAMYNIVEDDGMERERALAWRGDKLVLSTMNNNLITEICKRWTKAMAEGKVTAAQEPEPLAAMMIGQLSRLNWDEVSDVGVNSLLNAYTPEAKKLVTELVSEGWVERFRATNTVHDTWDVAVDLAKRLYPNNDQQKYEEMRQAGHSKEGKRDNSEDPKASITKGDSKNCDDNDQALSNTPSMEDGRVISWKDAVLSEHNEWEQQEGPPGTIGIDWRGYKTKKGKVALMPTNKISVIDFSNSTHRLTDREKALGGHYDWANYMPSIYETGAFANRIRKYIQAKARSVVQKEKYHGKLDKGALVRLALPPIDGGEYNKRIFYDQRKHTLKDTAIFVLVDWSGSMCGAKMQYAADASQRLIHTFDRVLNVPVALAAFSNKRSRCDIGYIKKFGNRSTPPETIAQRFAKFYSWSSANNDSDALNWAWREILNRKETRKILIVLSDGCPTSSYSSCHSSTALQHVTSTIEKDGRVELYGVGIKSDAVEQFYTNHKVLYDVSEINETLFNIIKEGNNVKTRRSN